MSVAWGVLCIDCRLYAPRLGDSGFLGIPTLRTADPAPRWRMPTGVSAPVTFGAAHQALAGMGLLLQEVTEYHSFLQAHDPHELFLYNDHMADSDLHPRLTGWGWDAKATARTASGIMGHFLLACLACPDTFATSYGAWHPQAPREVEAEALRSFRRNILQADPSNFCRLHPALSPDDDLRRMRRFLKEHKGHPLRSEVEERSWKERRPD
jgi:hypothetical protein